MNNKHQNRLPPGPGSVFSLGNLYRFRKDSLAFLHQLSRQYGDVAYFKLGHLGVVFLNHPNHLKEVLTTHHNGFVKGRPLEMAKELLGDGLLTSEGAFHKRHSRIIQPAFHRNMMNAYGFAMGDYAVRLMENWEDGMEVDILDDMVKMSTGIAAKTMFNVDIISEAPELNKALDTIMELFGRITLPFAEILLKLPLPGTIRFYSAKKRLDQTIYKIIEERKKSQLKNGDLLSLLLQAQEDSVDGIGFSDQEIRDEAMTLFLTAYDTTSLALTWTWYLLSQNPEAANELRQELKSVLNGRIPTTEDFPNLKYTRKVFAEALRMYPPIYIIARQATEDFSIDSYRIPSGTIVLMSPYLIHHDNRFHKDPETFNPDNWSEDTITKGSRYEYIPFSMGPRSCIGQHYAWLEGVLVLATIAQFWQLELVPGHPVTFEQLLNLRPKYGMRMTVKRIADWNK